MPRKKPVLSDNQLKTIRTLKSLGYSNRMVATVMGLGRHIINELVTAEGLRATEGKKLKLVDYKNAALLSLSINAEDEKNRIAAIKGVEAPQERSGGSSAAINLDVKAEILRELKG